MESFIFDRGEVAELGVAALPVVEDLQVLEYFVGEFGACFPFLAVEEFGLHLRPERFHHRIVVAIADSSQRWHESGLFHAVGEGPGGELNSVVGVKNGARLGVTVADRHVQGVDDEVGVLGGVDGPADDFAAERIQDRAAVQFPFPRGMFDNIADPQRSVECAGNCG